MAKRPNLAAVDLTPTKRIGRPPKLPGSPEPDRGGKKAGTVRLPPEDWRRLRVQAALLDTSQLELVHRALHEWFERNPLPPGVKLQGSMMDEETRRYLDGMLARMEAQFSENCARIEAAIEKLREEVRSASRLIEPARRGDAP